MKAPTHARLGWIAEEMEEWARAGLLRAAKTIAGAAGPEVEIDGRRLVLLCSNDYLGLAGDDRVRAAAAEAADEWGAGAGASRLVSGTTALHRELERELAGFKGQADCVLFSSGYLANVGTIDALVGAEDAVFSDALNHASIIDGCRLSGARRVVYRHADPEHLDALLASTPARRRLVVTDAVFSMDGDLAPLDEIADVCDRHDAMLMVDEAHSTGVIGPRGAGAVEAFGLGGRVDVVMGTLSKALGAYLRNRARTHVFDTAPPPAVIAGALAALRVLRAEPERAASVREVAARLADGLLALGYRAARPAAAIVPVMVGDAREAMALSARLASEGVFCPAIRPPSVPEGTSRLRVTAMATHTDEHVGRALRAFERARAT